MDNKKGQGIVVAGTMLVDKINEISAYPESGQLTQISKLEQAPGGLVPNVGIDLKRISPELPVKAIFKVGADGEAEFLKNICLENGLDISGMSVKEDGRTSFTDVMSVVDGQRTFFCYAGASAEFGYDDIDFEYLDAQIFHLGYFLLLQKVDDGDGLKILKKVKEMGIETSIDLVSENSDRYSLVLPCLAYTDYLIINEMEAGKLTGIEPTDENMEKIAYRLKELGVIKKVIIHKPEYAVCLSDEGYSRVWSYQLPKGYIKGTTGAGDAFCAGSLYGIYNGWTDKEILEFGSASAVMALGSADATSGLKSEAEIREFCAQFNRKN